MNRSSALLSLAGAALVASCGNAKPCVGTGCLAVAGSYLVTVSPTMKCDSWAFRASPVWTMTVAQQGSALTFTIDPSSEPPEHVLTGTLDSSNAATVNEPPTAAPLNLPYATVTGSFSASTTGLVYQGTLILNSQSSVDAGPTEDCAGSFSFAAQLQGGLPDAGSSTSGTGSTSGSTGSSGSTSGSTSSSGGTTA